MGEYSAKYVKIDSKELKNTGTVEIISPPMTEQDILGVIGKAPKGGFEITRLEFLFDVLDIVRGKGSAEVIKYILTNKNAENLIYATVSSISKCTGVSRKVTGETIKQLKEKGLIKSVNKNIMMLHPKLLHKGDSRRESFLFNIYSKIINNSDNNNTGLI